MPRITRMRGLFAAVLGIAAIGCADDEIKSDLVTEGAPRIITVGVASESAGEAATYCSTDEQERVSQILCPTGEGGEPVAATPVADAPPLGWYVRTVFNELMVGDQIEELVELCDPSGQCQLDNNGDVIVFGTIANTQPVSLTCGGVEVAYDGWYYPSGNHLTNPPGPGIFVEPLDLIPTGTECEVSVRADLPSREGEPMDPSQIGPFGFQIAPLSVIVAEPADGATEVSPDAVLALGFNSFIDPATLAGTIVLEELTDPATEVLATVSVSAEDDTVVEIAPAAPLADDTMYRISVREGVADIVGGIYTGDATEITFTTGTTAMQ